MVLTDRVAVGPRGLEGVVEEVLAAGCPALQLREKTLPTRDLLELALRLRAMTRQADALLVVNDRLDVALAAGADGVHLGPDDLPVERVRALTPPGFLVGYSTDDPDEAQTAVAAGADYLGCGTIWPTRGKADAGAPIGPAGLDRVAASVGVPVLAIGGIDLEGARILSGTRAAGIAVMGAVMGAPDPGLRVRELLSAFPGRSAGAPP